MGQVEIVLEIEGGVKEIRLLPGNEQRFGDRRLYRFVTRLAPVFAAIDEELRAEPRGTAPVASSAPAQSGK